MEYMYIMYIQSSADVQCVKSVENTRCKKTSCNAHFCNLFRTTCSLGYNSILEIYSIGEMCVLTRTSSCSYMLCTSKYHHLEKVNQCVIHLFIHLLGGD